MASPRPNTSVTLDQIMLGNVASPQADAHSLPSSGAAGLALPAPGSGALGLRDTQPASGAVPAPRTSHSRGRSITKLRARSPSATSLSTRTTTPAPNLGGGGIAAAQAGSQVSLAPPPAGATPSDTHGPYRQRPLLHGSDGPSVISPAASNVAGPSGLPGGANAGSAGSGAEGHTPGTKAARSLSRGSSLNRLASRTMSVHEIKAATQVQFSEAAAAAPSGGGQLDAMVPQQQQGVSGSINSVSEKQHRIPTLVPLLVERAQAARTELRSLQTAAQQALMDLEKVELTRKQVEDERIAAEREADHVQRRIDAMVKKKHELEEMLVNLRRENDDLERDAEMTGAFLLAHANKAPAGAPLPRPPAH